MRIFGIDVSRWQTLNTADFEKMRRKSIEFCIVKASEGDLDDTKYEKYIRLARKHGMLLGAYHVMDGFVDPKVQAERFITTVSDGKYFPDFFVLDVEKSGVSQLEIAQFLNYWSLPLGIYSSERILSKYSDVRSMFDFEWLAEYEFNAHDDEKILLKELEDWKPRLAPPSQLWQFTNNMKFSSPDGQEHLDANVFHGDMLEFMRYVWAIPQ